ncbi:MAG: MBL fold metallo-hydrolase [Deltaproteobacteria bacterium]|nr:MBL fold metallo-hydrolase [Deltaproteobacteria bacterium]
MSERAASAADRKIGHVTVLGGDRGGRYPHGNSLLVEGSQETMLVDPSLSLVPRARALPRVDRVLNSHCHEDHIAGNHLFPSAPWLVHELDVVGLRSLDDMMAIYGYFGAAFTYMRQALIDEFHYTPRPDAERFRGGQVFDLGGVSVRVIHTPGHTRGHCCLAIEPDGVLYLSDIDLSSFGPYYGDAWSSLEDFERTLAAVRDLEARHYATFHHIGVVEGREEFLVRLDRFADVIGARERRLLEFLGEPRTLEEVVARRFVYRPTDPVPFADPVELRSMSQHVERLIAQGRVREVEPGRYRAAG